MSTQQLSILKVRKRDGNLVSFDAQKIQSALSKAFQAVRQPAPAHILEQLTAQVCALLNNANTTPSPSVEFIQDRVEEILIKNNHTKVAKAYILYRAEHEEKRFMEIKKAIANKQLTVLKKDSSSELFSIEHITTKLSRCSAGLKKINTLEIIDTLLHTIYNNISTRELDTLVLNGVKQKLEEHYEYSLFAARLLLTDLYQKIIQADLFTPTATQNYQNNFASYIEQGIQLDILNPALRTFDLKQLAASLVPERDMLFQFLGAQTIADRYLLRDRTDKRNVFELPQWLWMRVAMGIALNEPHKEARAIEFYNVLSQFHFISSTPTLFNSGTKHSQMSSCYVNSVEDSMQGIFKIYSDCALLSKWAGGIGTDWTNVRAKNATIKGTNGESQGIVPFIKIFNDIALAVNQGGKRKGAMAAYLEVWHADIEEFLELKKNTGDERRRAHDIHPACWIPDLFMQRVATKQDWTLFSPNLVPDLHALYGQAFAERYVYYESQNIPGAKKVKAVDLWRKMLTMLYETGHPWITFKDAINIRNTQSHAGFITSSNLCTEITLNTSNQETAVCNLGSINLAKMINNKKMDRPLLQQTITTAMRMLDNIIDINFYPIPEAARANKNSRPVGLGIMGYQDALYQLEIDFDSDENVSFADESMELISYYAFEASTYLAQERGAYPSFIGSAWDKGFLPIDTLRKLSQERQTPLQVDFITRLDHAALRERIKQHGMRNSNCLAIAPTATISNIAGTTPCVEPVFKNIFMKENLSGNFLIINPYLIVALENAGLWNAAIRAQIKYHNGSIIPIDDIPIEIRRRFKETFEIDPQWIIKTAAVRGKWIDQAASTNIFVKTQSGKVLSDIYFSAWEYGLKTTYYLRTLAASQITKTAVIEEAIPQQAAPLEKTAPEIKLCRIDNPDCEACQ